MAPPLTPWRYACGCNSVMKRVTKSSNFYIFLPYLSSNLGEDVPHRGTEGTRSGRPRLAGAMCHTSGAQWVLLTYRLTCQLPIDQIFKWPFLFYFFFWGWGRGGGEFRLKTLCNFVSLLLHELRERVGGTTQGCASSGTRPQHSCSQLQRSSLIARQPSLHACLWLTVWSVVGFLYIRILIKKISLIRREIWTLLLSD